MNIPEYLYPFKGHYFSRNGMRMHYLDEGQGEVVLMVHGNPTWSFYYRKLAQTLSKSYRVIVPDHIGCGFSDKPSAADYSYSLKDRIADLTALLDQLAIREPIHIVLHDWGGAIGMGLAVQDPDRIKSILLLNTAAFRKPAAKRLNPSIWLVRNTGIGKLLTLGGNAFSRGAVRFCTVKPLAHDVKQAYLAPYNNWHNRIATWKFVTDIPLHKQDRSYAILTHIEDSLPQFAEHPVLICWGKHDFVFNDHFLAKWKQFWPQAQVHYFERAGHYVLEDEGEAIAAIALEFFQQQARVDESGEAAGQ